MLNDRRNLFKVSLPISNELPQLTNEGIETKLAKQFVNLPPVKMKRNTSHQSLGCGNLPRNDSLFIVTQIVLPPVAVRKNSISKAQSKSTRNLRSKSNLPTRPQKLIREDSVDLDRQPLNSTISKEQDCIDTTDKSNCFGDLSP